jgi:hypothetical protein
MTASKVIQVYKTAMPQLTNKLSAYLGEADQTKVLSILSDIQQRIDCFQKGSS